MTNDKFVKTLMQSNVVGPMAQLIVCAAIDTYTKQVVDMGLPKFRKEMGKNSFIHPDRWFAGCKEIQDKIKARGSSFRSQPRKKE